MKKVPFTAAALGLTMLVASVPPMAAAKTIVKPVNKQIKTVVHTINSLPPIKLSSKSTIRLTEINVLTQDDANTLTYTLTITNQDTKSLDLLDYWTKVRTASGTSYTATLSAKDKEKKSVAPGASVTLTYIVKVAKTVKVSNLVFDVVKWDFSQPNYEKKLGQFKIPAYYLLSTPANSSKTLRINEFPIKVKVNQVTSYLSGNYNYVGVDLDIHNIGYRLFEDPKVRFVVKTASGTNFPLSADSSSVDYKIQPQDHKTLKLMGSIPKFVSLKNLELQIIQDDETTKMSLPMATLQLMSAKNQSVAVAPNKDKVIAVNSGKLTAGVKNVWLNQSYGESDLAVQFSLKNSGTTTVSVPKYTFEIHSKSGYTVPVTTTALDNLVLKPQEERSFKLNVTLPSDIAMQSLQLFVNAPQSQSAPAPTDGKETPTTPSPTVSSFSYPVGIFTLPEPTPMQNTAGVEQTMQTNSGLVGLTLSSVQRLPWSDGDLVAAKITITNRSEKTMMLPELTGQFKVDSAKLTSDMKLVSTQSVGLLGAGKSTDVYVVSKLPSYLDFTQLQISLMEKIGESSSEWFQFTNLGALPALPVIEKGKGYELKTPGRSETFKVLRSMVYSGVSSDLLYTELEVSNEEMHQINLSQIVGYYQSSTGRSYKAQVTQVDTSAGPSEKGLITIWTKLPKSQTTSDMKLVIGEGITDNKLTPVKTEPTGYINAAALELSTQQPNVQGNLTNVSIFPYSLTFNSVNAYLNGSSSVRVAFDYAMTRNTDYIMGEFGHKYVVELRDSSGRTFEKELTPETDLKVGAGGTYSFSIEDMVFEKMKAGNFTLTVYDLFQGQKLKLASQGYYYNTTQIVDTEKARE